MKEVSISRRLNRWRRRFGFMRFFEVANAGRLEKELNQIHIGNMKLYVNISRYRRAELELEVGLTREVRKQHKYVPMENKSKEERREKKGRQSFVDVVRSTSQEK